ncbi:MAG: DUF349 domain-containing protein, partial [Myxococcales bacterium]|nr:DUF349 domain-containing protein [Myxococcales bacterium]
ERRAAEEAERAARKQEAAERGAQIAASLDAMIGELESMLESTDGRAIDRLLGQAGKAFGQLVKVPGELRDALDGRYQQTRAKLVIKVQELREAEDWQRWSNVPRQEALIKEAEALLAADAPDLGQLKALQGRWKTVGPVPQKKSKELWEQFKKTCDQVFDKVRAGRAVEAEKFAASAALKEQLIEQAEGLADSSDWEATAMAFKELQRQWKESGPLPRKTGDALWKRFRAACDRFFERRKPQLDAQHAEQLDNLAAKERLCAQAEAAVEAAPAEGGWGASIAQIKDLQRAWKDVGFVPRKDADAIYRRFRAACDALFAKRDDARDAEVLAQRAELDTIHAEVVALDGDAAIGADAVARAAAVRVKLRELAGRDIRPSIELAGDVERMLRRVITGNPDAVAGTELDPEAMRARRDKLVARAEALLPAERPSIRADQSPEDIVAQLKNAIASRALGDFGGAGQDPFEAVDELRRHWAEIGPVIGDASEALLARFEEVCAQVIADAEAEGKVRPGRDDGRPERQERGDRADRPGERRRDRKERRGRRGDRAEAADVPTAAPDDQTIKVAV